MATLSATAASLRLCGFVQSTHLSRSPGAQRDGPDDLCAQGAILLTQTVHRWNTCLQIFPKPHSELSILGSIKRVGIGNDKNF